jgi:hypothetical protein
MWFYMKYIVNHNCGWRILMSIDCICSVCRSHNPVILFSYTRFLTWVTWRVPLVEEELLASQERCAYHRFSVSVVLLNVLFAYCVVFCGRSLCPLSHEQCTVCLFSYGNCIELHNTDERTSRYIIGQHKKLKRWAKTDPIKKSEMNSGAHEVSHGCEIHEILIIEKLNKTDVGKHHTDLISFCK